MPCLSGGSVISAGTGQNWPGIFSLFELLINLGGKFSPWSTVNILEQYVLSFPYVVVYSWGINQVYNGCFSAQTAHKLKFWQDKKT